MQHAPISSAEKMEWKTAKQAGARLFLPSEGGSFEVFNRRPMGEILEKCCVNDVVLLEKLKGVYWVRE